MGVDVAWMRRDLNVRLAMKCGGETWGVLLSLWLNAKEQRSADGRVKFGYVALGREAFVDPDVVEKIVATAVEVGVITDLEADDHGRMEGVLTDFAADDRRGRAAMKKAGQRSGQEGTEGDNGSSQGDNGPSCPPVSPCVPPDKKRGEEKDLADARSPGARSRARRAVDQDALPDGLAPHLAARIPALLAVLGEVQGQRGGNVPTVRGVGLAVKAYPRRDHMAVMRELEYWALAGKGQRKPVSDWGATYRTFLSNAADADPIRVAAGTAPVSAMSERERRNVERRARAADALGDLMRPTAAETIDGKEAA